MANMLIFNLQTHRRVKFYPDGGFSAPDFKGRPDVLFDIDIAPVKGISEDYWLEEGGRVRPMTAQEQSDFDQEQAAIKTAEEKSKNDLIVANTNFQADPSAENMKNLMNALLKFMGVSGSAL